MRTASGKSTAAPNLTKLIPPIARSRKRLKQRRSEFASEDAAVELREEKKK
jgi:hypothetical protein